jgi:hypothetical protein
MDLVCPEGLREEMGGLGLMVVVILILSGVVHGDQNHPPSLNIGADMIWV